LASDPLANNFSRSTMKITVGAAGSRRVTRMSASGAAASSE
jgi:hypothetical protein